MKNNIIFFSFYYIDIFFQHIICILIVGTDYGAGDANILTVRMVSCDQIFVFFEFFITAAFVLIWYITRPNMNNDAVWIFLDLGLGEILDFAPGKNRTFIFLLLLSFASLKPAIIESLAINVVPFLHSSAC